MVGVSDKRRRKLGITEAYWGSLNEDKKLLWKVMSKIATIIGAWLITKSGDAYIDGVITACSSAFSFMLIESQRSHTRYSAKMRKKIIRASVILGTWGIFFAGALYFIEAAIFSVATSLGSMQYPLAGDQYGNLTGAIVFIVFLLTALYAVTKAFQNLDVIGLIYHLPRRQMTNLLVRKQFDLRGGPGFICFELGVIWLTICYSGITSILVSGALDIVRIFSSAWTVIANT